MAGLKSPKKGGKDSSWSRISKWRRKDIFGIAYRQGSSPDHGIRLPSLIPRTVLRTSILISVTSMYCSWLHHIIRRSTLMLSVNVSRLVWRSSSSTRSPMMVWSRRMSWASADCNRASANQEHLYSMEGRLLLVTEVHWCGSPKVTATS